MLILGWYNYHHGNPARALELFKTALDRNAGPKAAEGYAMSLRALNRLAEAEAFAYEWRERAPENMKIYLDVATALLSQDPPPRLDTQVIGRIVPVVTAQRFSDGGPGAWLVLLQHGADPHGARLVPHSPELEGR